MTRTQRLAIEHKYMQAYAITQKRYPMTVDVKSMNAVDLIRETARFNSIRK